MNKQAAKSSCFFTYESLIWEAHLTYIRQAAHSEQFVHVSYFYFYCAVVRQQLRKIASSFNIQLFCQCSDQLQTFLLN